MFYTEATVTSQKVSDNGQMDRSQTFFSAEVSGFGSPSTSLPLSNHRPQQLKLKAFLGFTNWTFESHVHVHTVAERSRHRELFEAPSSVQACLGSAA